MESNCSLVGVSRVKVERAAVGYSIHWTARNYPIIHRSSNNFAAGKSAIYRLAARPPYRAIDCSQSPLRIW